MVGRIPGADAVVRSASRRGRVRSGELALAAVICAAAGGAVTAAGSGLVGLAFWWITHHH
jgi:hypothetical protein